MLLWLTTVALFISQSSFPNLSTHTIRELEIKNEVQSLLVTKNKKRSQQFTHFSRMANLATA